MNKPTEYERLISIGITQEDIKTIYSLPQIERDAVFIMEIIPYFALFVKAKQNRELSEARDRLLPKLISGEIEV